MTKQEEMKLMCEHLYVQLENTKKMEAVAVFVKDHLQDYWLYVDKIRKMLDDLYEAILEEVSLINCMREAEITGINYEDIYATAKIQYDFIEHVKDILSLK